MREDFGEQSFAGRYNKALTLMGSGDLAAARSLLRELVASSEGAEAERARELLAEAEAAVGSKMRSRFIEAYNRAVTSFNAREYESGVRILEEVLPTLPENSQEALKARTLLERFRTELGRRGG